MMELVILAISAVMLIIAMVKDDGAVFYLGCIMLVLGVYLEIAKVQGG